MDQKKFRSNTWDLSEFSQYRRFVGFFSNTGGLSELPPKSQGLIFGEPPVFLILADKPPVLNPNFFPPLIWTYPHGAQGVGALRLAAA